MKLIPTNEALNIVDVGLLSVRQTTQGIRKSLGQDIRKNKIRDNTKLGLDRLEADTARTKGKEKIIEQNHQIILFTQRRPLHTPIPTFIHIFLYIFFFVGLGTQKK